jgi:hypothetical protein
MKNQLGTSGKKTKALITAIHTKLQTGQIDITDLNIQLCQGEERLISDSHFKDIITQMECIQPIQPGSSLIEANPDFIVTSLDSQLDLAKKFKYVTGKLHHSRMGIVNSFHEYFETFGHFLINSRKSWETKHLIIEPVETLINALYAGLDKYLQLLKESGGNNIRTGNPKLLEGNIIQQLLESNTHEIFNEIHPDFFIQFRDKLGEYVNTYNESSTSQYTLTDIVEANINNKSRPYQLDSTCFDCPLKPLCPLYNWTQVDQNKFPLKILKDRYSIWEKMRAEGMVYKPEDFERKIDLLAEILSDKGETIGSWDIVEKELLGSFIADTFEFSMGKQSWHNILFLWLKHAKGLDLIADTGFVIKALNDGIIAREPGERFAKLFSGKFNVHAKIPSKFQLRRRKMEIGKNNFKDSTIAQLSSSRINILNVPLTHDLYQLMLDLNLYQSILELENAREILEQKYFKD